MRFKGSSQAQVRDRKWLFKHAREVILSGTATRADLESIRDRMPFSRRGEVLRNQLNARISKG